MTRFVLVLLAAMIAAVPCCGNDPRIVDARGPVGSDGSGSQMVCTGSGSSWLGLCNSDAECEGCICRSYGGHTMNCTKMCTTPADCPAPATMCFNNLCAM